MEVSCSSHQCAEVIGVCRPVQPVVVYRKLKSINLYISLFRLDLFHFVVKDKSHEMFSVPSENADNYDFSTNFAAVALYCQ